MATGTVKWFNAGKGFGLIEQRGGGPAVFAHYFSTAAPGCRELREGQPCPFEIAWGSRGLQPRTSRRCELNSAEGPPD
jgi:CspA family cold shock protein